jgi:anaerobic selenocysteine-containing dehydrogenase
VKPEQKAKQIGAERFKLLSHVGYDLVQESVRRVWGRGMTSSHHCFAHAPLLFRAILSGQPYPVRAMVTAANNPLLTYANAHLVFDALCKLDLYVVLDSWMTPSAQLADYVLPTASWLERPCLFSGSDTAGFLIGGEAAVPNVVPGQYERRTDYDVWKGLGERLGQVGYWPWKTLEEAYNHRLGPVGLTLKGFADRGGHWRVRESYRPYAEVGFATPTGKFELCSTVFEKLGFDPLPRYVEPVESPVSTPELARRYPLILMTGARFNVHYHSEHRQVRTLRIQHAEPVVQMHPGTAEEWDVQDGAWIWVETRRGKVRMRLRTTHAILPGVVHAQHGWWFPEMPGEKPGLHGVWESNVNVLTDDDPSQCNEMSGGWPLRSLLCRVSKVEESPTAEPV